MSSTVGVQHRVETSAARAEMKSASRRLERAGEQTYEAYISEQGGKPVAVQRQIGEVRNYLAAARRDAAAAVRLLRTDGSRSNDRFLPQARTIFHEVDYMARDARNWDHGGEDWFAMQKWADAANRVADRMASTKPEKVR